MVNQPNLFGEGERQQVGEAESQKEERKKGRRGCRSIECRGLRLEDAVVSHNPREEGSLRASYHAHRFAQDPHQSLISNSLRSCEEEEGDSDVKETE